MLEGLEVAFIVLTFGTNQHDIAAGLRRRAGGGRRGRGRRGSPYAAPLARVPENTLKFVVGVMLTSFGTFWGAEGAGADWPGSDAALPVLVVAIALLRAADWSRSCVGSARLTDSQSQRLTPAGTS